MKSAPGSVADPGVAAPGSNLLFLREEDMRLAQDLFLLCYRDLMGVCDPILAEHRLGRAHHRVLHFVGRNPAISVNALLGLLGVTKQSLARVLTPLVARGLVVQSGGRADRRQRLLNLTMAGEALERALFERQRDRLVLAYRAAGGTAVEGFRRVMRAMLDEKAKTYIQKKGQGSALVSLRAEPEEPEIKGF